MSEFVLNLDLDTLARTRLGTISAQIWAALNGHAFPEERWSDIPLAVLESITAAVDTLRVGAPTARSNFFEGPFELMFVLSGSTDVSVTGVDRRGLLQPVSAQTTLVAIENELSRTRAKLSAALQAVGWPET
jgi:hypothetical protein